MTIKPRVVIAFNSFWSAFLHDLNGLGEDVRRVVQSTCKVVHKSSDEYIESFKARIDSVGWDRALDTYASDRLSSIEIVDGLTIGATLDHLESQDRGNDAHTVWNHVYVLALFAHLYESGDQALFDASMDVLGKMQHGDDRHAIEEEIDGVIAEPTHTILSFVLRASEPPSAPSPPTSTPSHSFEDDGGLICSLAKEIADEIDVSKLPQVEKPEDLLKCMDFSDSNNVVGDILQKVSSKIQQRLANGQIRQDQLLAEAMKMMSTLSPSGAGSSGGGGSSAADLFSADNPLLAQAIKAMGGSRNKVRHESRAVMTKERLRAKLAQRREEQERRQ